MVTYVRYGAQLNAAHASINSVQLGGKLLQVNFIRIIGR
jgi:hypothetical protein